MSTPADIWARSDYAPTAAALLDALRGHLEERAGQDGSIRASAGYVLITARR